MPTTPAADPVLVTRDDLRRLEQAIATLLGTLEKVIQDQQVQFTRIAQLQADFDLIRGAWAKVKPEMPTVKGQSYVGPERRKTARKK